MAMDLDVAAPLDTFDSLLRPGKLIITDQFSVILHKQRIFPYSRSTTNNSDVAIRTNCS